MTTDPHLPATSDRDTSLAEPSHTPALEPRQNLAVALLPLAIISFLVLAFIAVAWTFLAGA